MGRINSSIGSFAQNPNSANGVKKFTVDDPTMREPQVERHFQSTEPINEKIEAAESEDIFKELEEIRQTRVSLEPDKKNKIELLLGLKRKYANLKIDDHVITLRNLSAKETKVLINTAFTMQLEDRKVDYIYDIRNYTLAFAIYAIDDVKISDILGDNDNMETRISLIEEMPEDSVSEMHAFYEEHIVVKAPKSKEEAKEVIDSIKK